MLAQTQCLERTPVATFEELASILLNESGAYKAFYVTDIPDVLFLANGNVDSPYFETAVVKCNSDGTYDVIEGLTVGWTKGRARVDLLVLGSQSTEVCRANIPLSFSKDELKNVLANYTCGCCGSWFKSNAYYQQQFDQDCGIGICKDCEGYYL